MTDELIAAKLLTRGETDGARYPALRRVGAAMSDGAQPMEQYKEEVKSVRSSLSE